MVLDVLCGFLNLSYSNLLISRTSHLMIAAQLLIRVTGFVLANYYNALLASFLAVTIFGEQIETFEQMNNEGLKIIVTRAKYEVLMKRPIPDSFKKILIPDDTDILSKLRTKLNTSFAYILPTDRWEYLNLQQQFMDKLLFHRTKLCFGSPFLQFQLWFDSYLTEPFSYFIMKTQSAGLYSHWKRTTFLEALKTDNIKYAEDHDVEKMDLNFFLAGWILLVVGWFCGFLVFIAEKKYFVL